MKMEREIQNIESHTHTHAHTLCLHEAQKSDNNQTFTSTRKLQE